MAISKAIRPSVIVFGVVSRINPRRRNADNVVYAHEVFIVQTSGAQAAVTVYVRDDASSVQLPIIGELWAVECTVEESRDFGASLIYEAPADSALDQLVKA